MRLEQSLVLNRYFHWLSGARGLEDLKQVLVRVEEGPGADGQSRFFHAIAGLKGLRLPEEKLQEYDAHVVGYESRLAKARGGFVFKYFQYLSLLYTEIFLDLLTDDPTAFLRELNAFLDGLRNQEIALSTFQAFEPGDLRRLAFFMATGSGKSILLEELGGANLVFVDEGHKGTGSEARTWKGRQRRLSADGFALEYSATFAQSIGAASPKVRDDLLAEYGKTILFDYSYRHFYDDGYGKDFRVLNLAKAREARAHEMLLGGLLTYYQQVRLYRVNEGEYRPYNLERPLWVFLGSSVNAVYSQDRQRRSDVATIVAFLRHFLDEPAWAVGTIRRILKGESGFTDQESKEDLFAPQLNHLKGMEAQDLYKQIAAEVFHGRGSLEVWELKGAEGELALRVSTPEGKENPYFGVINIGDVSAFKKYLAEHLKIEVREDRFTPSLFAEVNTQRSRVCVLIGAKKFIEGWSSWRVSTMGLLNMGKGEGPQVIQLFGRGVRLKGKRWTLKRSSMLPEEGPHPDSLSGLETLFIFGWNADYIQAFREMLEREEVVRELRVPTRTLFDPWPRLPIPRPQAGYRVESETWSLRAEPLQVSVDLTPKITAMAGKAEAVGTVGRRRRVDFSQPMTAELLDLDAMYAEVVEYKAARRYGNLFVPRDQLLPILKASTLLMAEEDLRDPELIQDGALKVLKTYLDRFVAVKEREAEARHLEPTPLPAVHESIVPYYTIRVSSEELLRELESLLRKPTELYSDGGKPLPRLHVERHLFTPLLVDPAERGLPGISVSPPGLAGGEEDVAKSLREFWKTHHKADPYRHLEVFLLRNLPRVGVGFFRRSGFYPDFILWIKDKATKGTRIRFLEPHGMHHGGLSGNREKIEALKELEDLSKEAPFRAKKITMDGYIVTQSKREEIPGAEDKDWPTLERDYRLLQQDGEYFEKLLRAT